MYEKYGEFDSAEELNAKAEELKGKRDELMALAAENGIDKEDVEDYMAGDLPELANQLMAAVGKIDVEAAELKLMGVLLDWAQELKMECSVSPAFAAAVRKKGNDLAGYIAAVAEEGFENRCTVDKRIVAKTKKLKSAIGSHELAIGVPDKATRRELARKHYMKG